MENTFFICSKDKLSIDRFHICSWEFNNQQSLLEFGAEINASSIRNKEELTLNLFVPWVTKANKIDDLYKQLCDTANSRFIFNDSINATKSLDGGRNNVGVIHSFEDRKALCILPITTSIGLNGNISIDIDLKSYKGVVQEAINVYFRFCIKIKSGYISTRKLGINKSTIIYDLKINEKRNIPENQISELAGKELCDIDKCFCFNILPNRYDMIVADTSLKSVRTLEHGSFNKYLGKVITIPKG